jgi:hypothetical protein
MCCLKKIGSFITTSFESAILSITELKFIFLHFKFSCFFKNYQMQNIFEDLKSHFRLWLLCLIRSLPNIIWKLRREGQGNL